MDDGPRTQGLGLGSGYGSVSGSGSTGEAAAAALLPRYSHSDLEANRCQQQPSATANSNASIDDSGTGTGTGTGTTGGASSSLVWTRHQFFRRQYSRRRQQIRGLLSSKQKHYIIMALVVADVSVILSDIFVALVSCDMHLHDEWVEKVHEALKIVGLVFSSLFLLELLVSVWAWGIRFFFSWFHCFDALVIVASFTIEVLTHGVLEEIASIVVILRLLRFVKIVDEISLGAAERLEGATARAEALERENTELKRQLEASGA